MDIQVEISGEVLDDNAFGSDFDESGESVTTQAAESAATETPGDKDNPAPVASQATAPKIPAAPARQDSGPGDVREALRQEREARRVDRARLDQLEAHYRHQQQAQADADWQARIAAELEQLDPEDVPGYLREQETERSRQYEAHAQQQQTVTRMQLSEEYARAQYPDYDQQINKMLGQFGSDFANWASQQPNPALAAYQAAASFRTQAEVDALVEAARQEAVANATGKAPRRPSAPPRVGGLPVAAKPSHGDEQIAQTLRGLSNPAGSDAYDATVDALFRLAEG